MPFFEILHVNNSCEQLLIKYIIPTGRRIYYIYNQRIRRRKIILLKKFGNLLQKRELECLTALFYYLLLYLLIRKISSHLPSNSLGGIPLYQYIILCYHNKTLCIGRIIYIPIQHMIMQYQSKRYCLSNTFKTLDKLCA